MKFKSSALILVLILGFAFLIFGCIQQPAKPTPTASPSPSPSPSIEASPTVTPTPIVTLTPTNVAVAPLTKQEFLNQCSQLTDADRLDCSLKAAVRYSDADLCTQQTDSNDLNLCLGIVKKSFSTCKQITNESKLATCLEGVGVATKNVYICEQIPSSQAQNRLECVNNIAFITRSEKPCLDKLTGDLKDYQTVCKALAAHDAKLCSSLQDSAFADNCYMTLAIALKDKSVCGSLSDAASTTGCAIGVEQTVDIAAALGG
jgi:hypothetical protein